MKSKSIFIIIFSCILMLIVIPFLRHQTPAISAHFQSNNQDLDMPVSSATLSTFKTIKDALVHVNPDIDQKQAELALKATIVIENNPMSDSPDICVYSNIGNERFCYPKHFQPLNEWKPVLWGQTISSGLDVRIDLSALERYAKINSDFHPYKNRPIDSELKLDQLSQYERNLVSLLEEYSKNPFTPKVWFPFMDAIQELSHEQKNGKRFADNIEIVTRVPIPNSIPNTPALLFLDLLDHLNINVRKIAAITIGNAVENNYEAQAELDKLTRIGMEHPVLKLVRKLQFEDSVAVKSEYIFALAQFTRGNLNGGNLLFQSTTSNENETGLNVLLELFKNSNTQTDNPLSKKETIRFRSKIIQLISDLFVNVFQHESPKSPKKDAFWRNNDNIETIKRWCHQLEQSAIDSIQKLDGQYVEEREYLYSIAENGMMGLETIEKISRHDALDIHNLTDEVRNIFGRYKSMQ